ncbi:MAG TPA: GntR family transcriptional regulator [Tepidisphaeraceae bacterium]|nr:GntR family transcriptional regulator [Tepidisphaeraceae bacterium]
MRIEPNSTIPIFQQIVEGIRSAVAAGVYKPGDLIPSVRAQAVASLVNPNTVQRAYEQLEREGLITSRKGMGMVVAANGQDVAQDGTVRSVQTAFVQGIGLGKQAGLSRPAIDKIYRQSWSQP